jgi:hypothetical protein
MTQQKIHTQVTPCEALDHFVENVWPTLFVGEKRTSSEYKRAYALVRARRLEKEGKASKAKVSDGWIVKTLERFGGRVQVGDSWVARYAFETEVTCFVRQGQE